MRNHAEWGDFKFHPRVAGPAGKIIQEVAIIEKSIKGGRGGQEPEITKREGGVSNNYLGGGKKEEMQKNLVLKSRSEKKRKALVKVGRL